MIKKDLSDKDKKDWEDFLNNNTNLPNKDHLEFKENKILKRFKFDFHGYTIDGANKKIDEIIRNCSNKGILEILIITGKGIHSNTDKNVYVSENLSKLKYSIPDYIKRNSHLNSKIQKIEQVDENFGGSGAILIKLKKL